MASRLLALNPKPLTLNRIDVLRRSVQRQPKFCRLDQGRSLEGALGSIRSFPKFRVKGLGF